MIYRPEPLNGNLIKSTVKRMESGSTGKLGLIRSTLVPYSTTMWENDNPRQVVWAYNLHDCPLSYRSYMQRNAIINKINEMISITFGAVQWSRFNMARKNVLEIKRTSDEVDRPEARTHDRTPVIRRALQQQHTQRGACAEAADQMWETRAD